MQNYVDDDEGLLPNEDSGEPFIDNQKEGVSMLKDAFGSLSEDNEISKIKLIDSTLGDIGKIIEMQDVDMTETEKFFGGEKFNVFNNNVNFYMHHILQFCQEKLFKTKGYRIIKSFSSQNNSLTEPQMTSIKCDKEKSFIAYSNGYILYQKGNKKIITRLCLSYDESMAYYYIYSNMSREEISKFWDEWIALAKKMNFYRGKKIDGRCSFLNLNKDISWDKIILTDKVKKIIKRNVNGLYKNRKILIKNGISTKRGIIFSGVPGVGKTMVCKVLAQEMPITVIYVLPSFIRNPSDITRICDMASDLSPTLLIFEDIDYITEDREESGNSGWFSIELMNRLDGLEEMNGVITIATTNIIEKVENAVKNRPGRFDKIIKIPVPDHNSRVKMINKFTSNFILDKDVDLKKMVDGTKKMPGAYIKHLCESAAILAIEDGCLDKDKIVIVSQTHFDEALDEIRDKDFGTGSIFKEEEPIGFAANTAKPNGPGVKKRGRSRKPSPPR